MATMTFYTTGIEWPGAILSVYIIYIVVRTHGSGNEGCRVRNEVCISGVCVYIYNTPAVAPWRRDGPLSLYIRREIMK